MLDPIVFVLFFVLPFWLSVRTGSYWCALAPVALLAFTLAQLRATEPYGDDIDGLRVVLPLGCGLGVLVCLAGAAFGRRFRPSDGQH